jgi:hypothetical protein
MTGKESSNVTENPDALEVMPAREKRVLEGWVPDIAAEEELRQALENAFDYRGNVTITTRDGRKIEGYIFDRRTGPTLAASAVRLIPKPATKDEPPQKLTIPFSDIAALAFTGRDMAAGKQWENWVRHYWEKKAAGEKNIALKPESLE